MVDKCFLWIFCTASSEPEKSLPASPPKFESFFNEYIRTQEGDTVELECQVSGNPPPDVTWTIDNKIVENSTTSQEVVYCGTFYHFDLRQPSTFIRRLYFVIFRMGKLALPSRQSAAAMAVTSNVS